MEQKVVEFNRVNSYDINNEYNSQLDDVLSQLKEINIINNEFNSIVESQGELISDIEKNTEKSANNIHSSNEQLIQISGYQKSIFWKKSFMITAGTTIITAPLAVFVGTKVAIIAGCGTIICGLYNMF
jgi:predicted PurR-regulated permease PerM